MADKVYKTVELVGTSKKSYADATSKAVERAAKTLHGLGWFEVTQLRGRVEDGKIREYQVMVKVGFELDG